LVQYQATLNYSFSALADPTRRDILERLGRGPATISELAEPYGMSLTGLKKHVRILEEADLVTTDREQLEDAAQWIEMYQSRWDRRLDRLEAYLERKKGNRK
jgi:DNA-binding transcriptional ArsR family regulator